MIFASNSVASQRDSQASGGLVSQAVDKSDANIDRFEENERKHNSDDEDDYTAPPPPPKPASATAASSKTAQAVRVACWQEKAFAIQCVQGLLNALAGREEQFDLAKARALRKEAREKGVNPLPEFLVLHLPQV